MSERSPRFCLWWIRDWVSQHSTIAFMCTVTSRQVGYECTVGTFTTLGECGLSLSLGLRPTKAHSSNQEIKSN